MKLMPKNLQNIFKRGVFVLATLSITLLSACSSGGENTTGGTDAAGTTTDTTSTTSGTTSGTTDTTSTGTTSGN